MGQDRQTKSAEIDRNLEAFLRVLPDILADHVGEYALLHDRTIVGYFPSALDAQIAGNQRYEPAQFSIQLVGNTPSELGFYTYALHTR